jgi:hypothetical protein
MATVNSSGDDSGSGDDSDGSGGSAAAGGEYSQLLPQALSTSIMAAGGLGIAQQIAVTLDPAIGATAKR